MEFNENITFNFSDSFYKDVKTLDVLIQAYINVRKNVYQDVFCSEESYDESDINDYIAYFTTPSCDITQDVYDDLYHIQNFLNRDYEIYIQQDINSIRCQLQSLISCEVYPYEDFEQEEFDNLQKLQSLWDEFKQKTSEAPLLNLDKMEYQNINGVQCYFDKNTEDFVMESFIEFMNTLHNKFPNTLLKLDTCVIVPKDYIEYVGGEGTQAFFTDNALFLASTCDDKNDEEERCFYKLVLYHELGHFIYTLLSETSRIMWSDLYKTWREKKVKMTRDDDKNSQLYDEDGNETNENKEELWSDTFATILYDGELKDEYYIHKPSSLITNSVDFILRSEFK